MFHSVSLLSQAPLARGSCLPSVLFHSVLGAGRCRVASVLRKGLVGGMVCTTCYTAMVKCKALSLTIVVIIILFKISYSEQRSSQKVIGLDHSSSSTRLMRSCDKNVLKPQIWFVITIPLHKFLVRMFGESMYV